MRLLFLIFAAITFGALSACERADFIDDTVDFSERKIRVVATTNIVADLVANIGGERLEVVSLMGPGVDPHLYRASEGDVRRMRDADIIFYNGLHLEGRMADLFDQMQRRIRTVAVADGIDPLLLDATPEFEGNYDPHVWFDVSMWMQAAEFVRDYLMDVDSVHAGIYERNASQYLAELDSLHRYVRVEAQRVPEERRVIVTAHDAFHYFGRAYGFEVRGLQGISTAAEAGTADVQELARFIVERRIPAIFIETSVPTRSIEAVRAAARARGLPVEIGGHLYSDALGSPGTPTGTYVGTVRHNIDTIVEALLRELPPA